MSPLAPRLSAALLSLSLSLLLLLLLPLPFASARPHTLLSIAGTWGVPGTAGDGGPASKAGLKSPSGIAVDSKGNILVADGSSYRVRRISVESGLISTIACTGTPGNAGDGGPATSANCGQVQSVVVDAKDNVYFSDSMYYVVRKVNATTGIITTVAGTGSTPGSGEGGPATSANLGGPYGLAVDPATGNIYIAEAGDSKIRVVNSSTGIISTYAGSGASGSSGDGGPATSAGLFYPYKLSVDGAGNLYFAEFYGKVRRVDARTKIITTVAGGGTAVPRLDGGTLAIDTKLDRAYAVHVHRSGFPIHIAAYGRILAINATGHIRQVVGINPAPQVEAFTSGTFDASPKDPDDRWYVNDIVAVDYGAAGREPMLLLATGHSVIAAYMPESSFSGAVELAAAASTCNFTSVGQRDLVGALLQHTSATHESACQLACCSNPACDGYSFAPRPASAAYEGIDFFHAEYWRRVSGEPSEWHTSCFLLANVTHSVYSNALRSGVKTSLL
jgi:hypothetical protein